MGRRLWVRTLDRVSSRWPRPAGCAADPTGAILTFESLGLSADLLRTVAEEGYVKPTPVQAAGVLPWCAVTVSLVFGMKGAPFASFGRPGG